MATAFDDLIPQGDAASDPFGDLVPTAPKKSAAKAQPGTYGDGSSVAVFADDATPKSIPEELLKKYNAFSHTAKTGEELVQFGRDNGFEVPLKQARQFIIAREKAGGAVGPGVSEVVAEPIALPTEAKAEQADIAHSDGMIDRVGDLLSRGASGVGAGAYSLGAALHDINNIRLPWQSDEDYYANLGGSRLAQLDLRRNAAIDSALAGTPIEDEQSFQNIDGLGSLGKFVFEQGIGSAPGMLTAMLSPIAYAATNTGNIAQQRAANDGRDDATIGDVLTAAPAGIASAALERAGIESIFSPHAGSLALRIGKAALGEGATETGQTGVEYLGGNLGTDAGVDAGDMLQQMEAAAVAGAGAGGGIHGALQLPGAVAKTAQAANDTATGLPALMSALALEAPAPAVPQSPLEPTSQPLIAPIPDPIESGGKPPETRPEALSLDPPTDAFSDLVPQSTAPSVPEAQQPVEPQPVAEMEPHPAAPSNGLGQPAEPTPAAPTPAARGAHNPDDYTDQQHEELPNTSKNWKGGPDAKVQTAQDPDGKFRYAVGWNDGSSGHGAFFNHSPQFDTREEARAAGFAKLASTMSGEGQNEAAQKRRARIREWLGGNGPTEPVAAPEPAAAPAPAPLPQTAQPSQAQELQDGEKHVRTPAGNKVRTRMEVVEASSLNKATGDLQNRDRSRDTTALQVQDIISKFDPELLGDDPSSDRGAPIAGQDHTVLSGNGRMLALNEIYDNHPEKAAAYRQFVEAQGHKTDGLERPVLIRRVTQDMTPEDARQFVVESNTDNKLELSPVERARSDADGVTPEMLSKYAGGDLNSTANKGFVTEFMKSRTAADLGGMLETKDRLSTKGIERIENAVVAKAYDHPKLLEKLMESSDNEIRAITSSLANVAPAWASMRETAKAGEIASHYDITSDLADAAMRVAEARRRGEKPADILTQQDAFDRLSPATEALIRAFYNPQMTRAAGVKSVTEFLQDYIDEAKAQKPTVDIFGDSNPGKAPLDILRELLRQRDNPNGGSLFDSPLENSHEFPQRVSRTSAPTADEGRHASEADDALDVGHPPADADAPRHSAAARAAAARSARDGSVADRGADEHATAEDGTAERNRRFADAADYHPDEERPGGQHGSARHRVSPADASDGAYKRTHAKGATTDRASDLRSAVEHLGMSWDDFNLKAAPTQMQLLQRAMREKLGIKVTVDHGDLGPSRGSIPYRVAIDQMLDGFHNISGMAAVLGLPEKAMSLNGTLTLELRKSARFYGAFYPGLDKIALPGRSNSFAHEWGHALDFYLMGQFAAAEGKGLSGLIRKSGTESVRSREIAARFADLMSAMFFDKAELAAKVMELEAKIASVKTPSAKARFERQLERIKQGAGQHRSGRTDFYKAAKSFDGGEGDYWQSPTEMLARSFEAYVAHKAAAAGMSTEVISHADADYLSNADERLASTFPKEEERQAIFDAYDELFGTLAGRETLGTGEAAQVPANPARRAEPTPERISAYRNIVRNELGAFTDWQRSREKAAGTPKDRKGVLQKANDIRHFFFSGMAAELRALGRRWDSRAIAQLHDLLVSEAGRGDRLQRRDFIMARRLRGNRYTNSIERALIDFGPRKVEGGTSNATVLSKEQAADVRGLMVNEDYIPVNPELKTLASRLREISDGIWHDLRATGFSIGYTRNGHLPRIYDVPKAEADMQGFLRQAKAVYEAAGLEEADARKAAAEWYYRLVQSSPHNFDQHTPNGDFLKGRELPPEADMLMADYMVNEPMDLMRRYAEAAAHRIEWAKRFGIDNSGLNNLYGRMARENVDRRDIETIRTMLDIMAGQNPMRQKDPTLNAIGSGFNTIYGTVALLGRASFQSLAESITSGIVLENPVYGVKALADLISGAFGTASAKERRELVEFIGLVDVTNHTRLLADRFGGSYDDPVSMQKITNKLFYNTGLIALTRAQYTHTIGVLNAYLVRLSHKLLSADEDSNAAKEVLDRFKELGIRDPKPFAQWMTMHGGPSIIHRTSLPSKADLAEGLEERGAAPWAFDWITAVRRLSERVVQDPHGMTKPRFSHAGNLGRLATGIQAFNYSFYENVLKPVWKRNADRIAAGRPGMAATALGGTAAGFGTLFLGQLLATTLRVFLTDRERWREEEAKGTLYSYLLGRTATSFIGNPMDPAVQALKGYKYNRDPLNSFSGPAIGNFASNASDVIKLGSRNSRKTNTAEHNAINGAYRLMAPWASAGIGSIPGGPFLSGAEGAAQGYITSPQAGRDVATLIVGEKNGRVGKDGEKVKSGPSGYDRFLDRTRGEVKRKPREE